MRYVEVVLLILVFMITASAMSGMGLVPFGTSRERLGTGIYDQRMMNVSFVEEPYNEFILNPDDAGTVYDGDLDCSLEQNKDSLECSLRTYMDSTAGGSGWTKASTFLEPGIISSILQFIKVFSTGITHANSIISSFIPQQSPLRDHMYLITLPIMFMYLIALFQVVSGRNLEGTK